MNIDTDELTDIMTMAGIAEKVRAVQGSKEWYSQIQRYYREMWPFVKKTPVHRWATDPYAINWHFTPIEAALWSDIRSEGAVLYPQHPVGRYLVDFGHPVARVAIECDGKQFHTDKAKDKERQTEIEAYGWTVYRLTGRQCMQDSRDDVDEYGRECWEIGDALRLIREVCKKHGISPLYARQAA